jgi:putative DNA primase/helicase
MKGAVPERKAEERGAEIPSPLEPMAVARRLVVARYQEDGRLLLRRWRSSWWVWTTTCWREVDEPQVRGVAYSFTEHAVWIDTSKKTPTVEPWNPNRYKIADLLDALGAIAHLREDVHPPEWLVESPELPQAGELVAVANGLLHVPTRTLHPHDPRLFNAVAVPFAYSPVVGEPVRWLRFLCDLWDDVESIAALQEFFGYVISGRTDLHKVLLLIGPTRAGKGVIAHVLKGLVGRGSYAGPTLASLGTNFGLSPLIGKPLAIVSDARLGGANIHQVVERLLSISGEDVLTIDRKYREPWTGTLPTRLLVISNELPRFGDASGAIANRFVVLNLIRSWLGRENTGLTRELLTELPGILNWSLDGLERLRGAGRFTEPESSRDAVVALQDLVSPVAAFARDRCERGPYEVECKFLYEEWKAWAEETGHRPGSLQTFGRDLRAVVPGLGVVRPRDDQNEDKRPRHYRGITLARLHNAGDRGPMRTNAPVHGGPRPGPLYAATGDSDGEVAEVARSNADPPNLPMRAGMKEVAANATQVSHLRHPPEPGNGSDPYGSDPPTVPCRACRGVEYHRAGSGWTCSRCHPAPKGSAGGRVA